MKKKLIFLVIIAIFIAVGTGFWLMATFSEPKSTRPITTTPNQSITINQPSGNFNCEDMYDEIENDLDRANFCQSDSDCAVIMLGGWYIDFGCYHFINKNVEQEQFFTKMDAYKEKKCSQIINDCSPAPNAKCISNKCVYVE